MAKVCQICGKKPSVGYKISPSYRHTKRRWLPNLQRVTAVINGHRKRIVACTSCIRAGKVKKAG